MEMLIEYVRLFQQGDETFDACKTLLIEQRDALAKRVAEMQKTLDRLNIKVDHYEKTIVPIEHDLKRVKNNDLPAQIINTIVSSS